MRKLLKIALLVALPLSACAPLSVYYKPGETVARMTRDETDCEVTAYRQVPPDLRSRYIPPTYDTYRTCTPQGYCTWRRILVSSGRFERYDANLSLRDRVAQQCMADRGYRLTQIKQCDAATTEAAKLEVTQVMPPLSAKSCAIRFKTGRWQIVTP